MNAALNALASHVLVLRGNRMAVGRTATALEARAETFALQHLRMMPKSARQAARDFGWSPGKLRRLYRDWATDDELMGGTECHPRWPSTWDRA